MRKHLSKALALALAMSSLASVSLAEGSVLNVWCWNDEFQSRFNAYYPEVKEVAEDKSTTTLNDGTIVKWTINPNADNNYQNKLDEALLSQESAADDDKIDMFLIEADYALKYVDSPYTLDVRADIGLTDGDLDGQYKYTQDIATADGVLKGVTWQATPGLFAYRRSIAKDVLGTDDPTEVAALLSSNDAMLDVAAKLKDKGIKMFASWQDIMNMQFSNRAQPWVVDDRLVIDESMLDFMDMAKTIAENGYDLNVDPWAPEWSAAVESTDTFCYVLPSWGYQFVVKPAADTTKGQWAMCQGSVPYVKGGTWLGIYKDSPNKDLAWAFLEYCCLNSEAQQAYAAEYGEYVSLKSADQALAAGAGEEVLGGQNPFAFYNEQMEKIPSDLMTAYDGTINTAFLSAAKAYATGVLSKDDALQQFKDDVANAYPELTID